MLLRVEHFHQVKGQRNKELKVPPHPFGVRCPSTSELAEWVDPHEQTHICPHTFFH